METSKYIKIVEQPGLHARSRWGSLRRFSRHPAGWEGANCPSPITPPPLSALRP